MSSRCLVLLSAVGLLLLAGCRGVSTSFSPLDEGETWTYQVNIGSMLGSMDANTRQVVFTVVNMPTRELAGKSVTPQKAEIDGHTFAISFVGEDSDGVFTLASQSPNATEPTIKTPPEYGLHRPFKSGTKWDLQSTTQTLSVQVPVTLHVAIESDNDTITVPIGTLERCLKLVSQGDTTHQMGPFMGGPRIHVDDTSWFCPGIGYAKEVRKETNKFWHGEMSVQLESRGKREK
jgi:hypothetical protein